MDPGGRKAVGLAHIVGAAAVLISCAGSEPTPTFTPLPTVVPTFTPALSPVPILSPTPRENPPPTQQADLTPTPTLISAIPRPVALEPALGGLVFDRPVELGAYPDDRVFVADQDGLVLLLTLEGADASTLLDLRQQVSRQGNEEGLLSVALDPAFEENGHLWAYYSVAEGPRRTRLSRFQIANDVAEVGSELVILEVRQPFSNHNGGAIRFGPDGMLYLGFGDGGSGGDPEGNGQNPRTLLGSIIRIDVREASLDQPYLVPSDNPFLLGGGRPEIWAYGLRNPWRMTFDPATGRLWVADVGQNEIEEIDIVVEGGNYGWNRLEGNRCYQPSSGCSSAGTVLPIATYTHSDGCSVSGGVVYRGTRVSEITDAYLYGDFCSGRVWAVDADAPGMPVLIANASGNIASFGADASGEVYVLQFGGPVLRVVSP